MICHFIGKCTTPDSKVHGDNMRPSWVLSAPDGPHVGPMNLAIRDPIFGGWKHDTPSCACCHTMHHKKYALTRALLCFAVDSEQQNNANPNHVNILWYTLPLSANLWVYCIYISLFIGYLVRLSTYFVRYILFLSTNSHRCAIMVFRTHTDILSLYDFWFGW